MAAIVLVIVLVICLVTDIKSRKILNIVTIPTIIFGIIYNLITLGIDGLLFSGKGLLVGLGVLLIPYLLGGMGAGDVKLMAAIGALMGTTFVFYSFIYTALIGGVISILVMVTKKGFFSTLISFLFQVVFLKSNVGSLLLSQEKNARISFPYGIAIVLGTITTFIWGGV